MVISIKDKALHYELNIIYHFKCLDGITSHNFSTYDEFVEFMNECHPDIRYDELSNKYTKKVELITRLANDGIVENKYLMNKIHCFISGDSLIVTCSDVGNDEKMCEHFNMSEKVNNGYLHTFIAHSWSIRTEKDILGIKYWYDKSKEDLGIYKIHTFKDKVVIEDNNGVVHTMVVASNYWIYWDGKEKISK